MNVFSRRAAFAANAVVTAVAGALGRRPAFDVSKSLLVPLLHDARMSPTLQIALAGAWAGDVALLPPRTPEDDDAARRRLRRGAACFAVQQVGYLTLMRRAGIRPRAKVAVPVGLWLAGLGLLDARARDAGVDPVVGAYGVLLGTTVVTAMSSKEPDLGRGGAWFLASDSMILLRELMLRRPVARASGEVFVLLSYAVAQRHLVDGLTSRP